MARPSNFYKSIPTIKRDIHSMNKNVFSDQELLGMLEENRFKWNLPYSMTTRKFIDNLIDYLNFKQVEIRCVGKQSYLSPVITRYIINTNPFELALSLKSKSHLSHYSSLNLLGLTQQNPKTIYVTFEQSAKDKTNGKLSQESIDKAFANKQREPNHYYEYEGYRIIVLNSKFTKKAGITRVDTVFGNSLYMTNLERTLIDITVRPSYSGGINEVLEAYKEAKNNLSVNKLIAILKKLDYIYPYHQAIGFYLEKCGYKDTQLELFKDFEIKYDFYLTYDMKETNYDSKWRIFYPKGF